MYNDFTRKYNGYTTQFCFEKSLNFMILVSNWTTIGAQPENINILRKICKNISYYSYEEECLRSINKNENDKKSKVVRN